MDTFKVLCHLSFENAHPFREVLSFIGKSSENRSSLNLSKHPAFMQDKFRFWALKVLQQSVMWMNHGPLTKFHHKPCFLQMCPVLLALEMVVLWGQCRKTKTKAKTKKPNFILILNNIDSEEKMFRDKHRCEYNDYPQVRFFYAVNILRPLSLS